MLGVGIGSGLNYLRQRSGPSILLSGVSIPENSANGTAVGTASLTPGSTGTPAWSLTDATGTFQINSATGAITVLSNTLLDYEARTSIPVTLGVSGTTPAVGNLRIPIRITNVIEIPVNTVAPVVSGSTVSGSVLSTTNGTWTDMAGPGAATFAYQWKAGGVNIGGATGQTFTLTDTQIGASITCAVTATNTAGSASATSNSVGPVTATGGGFTPSLDFSDLRNSMYLPIAA